jgi:hypothetical protein
VVKKRNGHLHSPTPLSTFNPPQLDVTCCHALKINSTVPNVYTFSVPILLHMQNATPTVKAETFRSINPQIKVLCTKLVFSFTYLIAQCPGHTTCRFTSASAKYRLASEPYALRMVQCCHIALSTVVVQHSEYSNDTHTTEHLQHTNTFTVTTGADIKRRPTADPPHSIQCPVLTAVTQFDCMGTDRLLQRVQFTV